MSSNQNQILIAIIILFNLIFIGNSTIYYVDPNNTIPDGGGKKWEQAFTTLDQAIQSATKLNDKIFLMYNHIYYPDTTNRFDCFNASIKLSIYGGFLGNETHESQRVSSSQFYEEYPSIISGNINDKSINTDNCFHVITYQREFTLDGVTISDGYANYQKYETQKYVLHKYGGALITYDGSQKTQLTINNVRFINNYAINGGALWFSSNNVNHVAAKITNCQFINNHAIDGKYEGGYGGAIYLYFMSNITIENTQFYDNHADYKAGAIYQDYGGILSCHNCQFENNEAGAYGGALFAEDRNSQTTGTFPVITNSYFYNNSATYYGGAVCYFNDVKGTYSNNVFKSNTVYNGDGGAIALIGSEIVDLLEDINNNTFIKNKSPLHPKKRDLFNKSYTEYDTIDTNLTMDVMSYLKEIWDKYQDLPSDETDLYPFSNNEICYVDIDNLGANPTGATWNKAYNRIQDCINDLAENSNGGEIWVKAGNYTPSEVPAWKQKVGEKAPIHQSFIMYDNIRMYGGFDGSETSRYQRNFYKNPTYLTCELSNGEYCEQIANAADNSLIDGFIFIKAQWNNNDNRRRLADGDSLSVGEVLSSTAGNSGSGIYSNSTTISVVNSIFYKLFSSGKGGAIYCIGLQGHADAYPADDSSGFIKAPTIINTAFLGNRAAARGGAISADVQCEFECRYCIFEKNSCSKKGGAIYLDFDSDPTFIDTRFVDNYALESGGCLAEDGESNTTFMGNARFINNSAQWDGGCLYSGSGVGPGIEQGFIFDTYNVTFEGNYLFNQNEGQNNIYLWPYNIIDYDDTEAPTPSPTTAKPTKAPTGNYTFNKPPNFLIFVIDDILYTTELNKTIHGAAGTQLDNDTVQYLDVPTPNIYRIINEGISFQRTYCGGPKCSPARWSILTGRNAARNQFARHRTLQSSDGKEGTNVTIQTSKLLLNDSIHNIPYQLQNNENQKYYTGCVGKWHLMSFNDNGYNLNCSILNYKSDEQIYQQCTNIVKNQGFDFVDAFYHENIDTGATYGHNPEWITSRAQKFIDNSLEMDKPFFLYLAHTLTHDPEAYPSMFNFSIRDTPKGWLEGEEVPNNTGMHSREYLWQKALDEGYASGNRLNLAAMDIWVDDAFGALLNYLEAKQIMDNTFIVVINDHGMGSKGTLYEQGTRIWQMIRFPPLFGDNKHVLSNDFIVSSTDLASVIFDIANVTDYIDPSYILDDSTNWINDVIDDINDTTNGKDIRDSNDCCTVRYADMYNSHMIVMKDWKYIYRANEVVEQSGDIFNAYKYCFDREQLYYLPDDPNEQNNLMRNDSMAKEYNNIIYEMQTLMREYIQTRACPLEDVTECRMPDITFTKTPTAQPTDMTYSPTIDPTIAEPTNVPTDEITTASIDTTLIQDVDTTSVASDTGKGNKDGIIGNNEMYIIIGAAGGIVLLIILFIIIFIYCRRKKNELGDDQYVKMVDINDGHNFNTKVSYVD